jgi:ABC-type proline/glycine betaine transport system ATPase subunit
MNHGQVEQVGTPQNVVEQPGTDFVAQFLDLADHGPDWLIAAKLRHRTHPAIVSATGTLHSISGAI